MTSREQFEKTYAEAHGQPLDDFAKYRMGDSYRLPMIAKCWRFWVASRTEIEVELPESQEVSGYEDVGYNSALVDCAAAIESLGLKVKS